MARHNRDGKGSDQRGFEYSISYQPDWLRLVKVTRDLESGRQSTKTLFRNPASRQEAPPGDRIRTRITSSDQGLDFEVWVTDSQEAVARVQVSCKVPSGRRGGRNEELVFTLENGLPGSR